MKLPFGVVDADGHIVEPDDELRQYMVGPHGEVKKKIHPYIPNEDGFVGGGILSPTTFWDPTLGGKLGSYGPVGFPTPEDWLRAADEGSMETIYIFPTTLLSYSQISDNDYLIALTKAYNNYVHEKWLRYSPRFKSVALMPFPEVEESIKEMRRCVTELGFSGVFVAAAGFGMVGDKKYHPFYSEAEKLGAAIAVHGGHTPVQGVQYTKFIYSHTLSFPISLMMQLMHMTYEGVFEKFPKLRVGYLEAGCTWVPYMLDRMDEEWELRGSFDTPNCKKKPSEYVSDGNVFIHAEPGEQLIPEVIRVMGRNRIMYASDWPHWDHEYPESIFHIWGRKDLTEEQKKGILRDNALEFYGADNGA